MWYTYKSNFALPFIK